MLHSCLHLSGVHFRRVLGNFCAEVVVKENIRLQNCVMALRNTKQKRCCVLDCPSNIVNKNCRFYKFPTDFDSCQKWKFALKLIGTISDEHHVCEAHFDDDDFVGTNGKPKSKKQLKKDAHPTLNLPREHTYMKFGNPKRGRVTTKAKALKKPATKIGGERRPVEKGGGGGPSTAAAAPPHASASHFLLGKSAPRRHTLPPRPQQYPYVPWRVPGEVSAASVAAAHLLEQDPLALNYPPTHTYSTASPLYKTEMQKVMKSSQRNQAEGWVQPDSTQETASATLTLAQKILDEAATKVDVACKEIEDAIAANERFAGPSEPTEKITIHTEDSKVMELLLVKNNPKISNQVNEDFKTIDKLIDNAQAVLNSQNLSTGENRRLRTEISSLKRRLERMEKAYKESSMQKKVMMLCKDTAPGVSMFKKHPSKKGPATATSANRKKVPPSPTKKPETSSPAANSASAKLVKTFSLPKIISVTSLNGAVETEQSNAASDPTSSSSVTEMQVVDLTD
ncbi:unnamed protein product [Callosobruchus maculatus]|uniref:THAP-type domain-containing protein n=1 Tax=Callosobruchus maculatus TaxID=64391 RepID=A0A653D3V0_CALMS|nr:unnamed protein product [Callosobruchus maculatus]